MCTRGHLAENVDVKTFLEAASQKGSTLQEFSCVNNTEMLLFISLFVRAFYKAVFGLLIQNT
jgi:hypothetical protein